MRKLYFLISILLQIGGSRTATAQIWRTLGGESFHAVTFANGVFWLGSTDGKLMRSTDGVSWTLAKHSLDVVQAIRFQNDQVGLICGDGIERTEDGGITWHRVLSNKNILTGLTGFDNCDTVIAFGDYGDIFRSTDLGNHWFPATKQFNRTLLSATFVTQSRVFIISYDSTILCSADAGLNWTNKVIQGASQLFSVISLGDSILLAGGNSRTVYRSTDGGNTCHPLPLPQTATSNYVLSSLSGKLMIAGYSGSNRTWLESLDSGRTWLARVDSSAFAEWNHVLAVSDGSQSGDALRVGFPGLIQRTKDGGATWETVAEAPMHMRPIKTADYFAGSFLDSLTGLVFGSNATFLATKDGGVTWHPSYIDSTLYIKPDIIAVQRFSHDSMCALLSLNSPYVTTNGGSTWISSEIDHSKGHYTSISVSSKAAFLTGDSSIYRSVDGGIKWTQDTTFSGYRCGLLQFPSPDTGYVLVYASGKPSRLLRTTTAGDFWLEMRDVNVPAQFYFRTPLDGYFFKPGGVLLHTRDGCRTFDSSQVVFKPYLQDICFLTDSIAYLVGDTVGIYSTHNAGSSWERDSILFYSDPNMSRSISKFARAGSDLFAFGSEAIYKLDFTSNINGNATVASQPNAMEHSETVVYPNPATSILNINAAMQHVQILDALGRTYPVPNRDGTLDITALPLGVYYISDGSTHGAKQWSRFVKD